MNFKLELPEGTILISRTDLKEVLQEMLSEVQGDNVKEEIMTIREAAEYLKVSVPTVRNMIANREIPFFQRGQVIRLNRWDVKEWLRNNSKM
ncbi:helix-turn-helix domain-containing protein [Bacillus altitudinis]|uniref:helix-turn-helix domain-containing protein n=1 Tax=Bacillaceae TaxID=186817 RepID=UPI00099DBE9E|nr:helix-turn-helix domain-containing protein [Priestia flexa]AQX52861.1 DNA-binding protein [Priestia flexa]